MTCRQSFSRILVGFDGSAAGWAALSWGAWEARSSGAELVVLHAWGDVTRCRSPHVPAWAPTEETDRKAIAETVVSRAVATVRAGYPKLVVRPLLCRDRAARALPRHSDTVCRSRRAGRRARRRPPASLRRRRGRHRSL
ncbi:universal stress protein [Streptosporangium sp. NBC_01810]